MKLSAIQLLALLITAFSLPVHAQNPKLTEGFKRADSNGDGKLSADEVNQFPQLKAKLQGADKDGDGFITFDGIPHAFIGRSAAAEHADITGDKADGGRAHADDCRRRFAAALPRACAEEV